MTIEIFIAVFIVIAIADWWMDMVQRTTTLICRASNVSTQHIGKLLNPAFIKFAFPITIAKWILVAFWAWYDSAILAISLLALSWLASVISPLPIKLTLPAVLKQINRVRDVDKEMGEELIRLVEVWSSIGNRY